MRANLEPVADGDIVAENVHALQAIYFAQQLDAMRAFDVVDRLVERFQQGQLPLRSAGARRLLARCATAAGRLSARDRQRLYARALGATAVEGDGAQANHEFRSLWLRFVASVALFERQQDVSSLFGRPPSVSAAAVWRAARELAANASTHGAAEVDAVKHLSVAANRLRAVLQVPEIRKAFGARDMWEVIERVATASLGGARNVARYRKLAEAGSAILQWVAEHADALRKPVPPTPFPDPALLDAVQAWLAASDARNESGNDAKPTARPALEPPSAQLRALARELVQIMEIEAVAGERGPAIAPSVDPHPHRLLALFSGAAGTGKTLAAHVLAATLSRDLVRVDLRRVVGKTLDETEKNLDAALARAESIGAILLFDEAEALFGKRTDVKDARDRNARTTIDGIWHRLQLHEGLVILESTVAPSDSGAALGMQSHPRHVVDFPRRVDRPGAGDPGEPAASAVRRRPRHKDSRA